MTGSELQSIKKMEDSNAWLQENYESIRESYGNKFVAIENKEILASANTAEELLNELEEKKTDTSAILIEFIPEKGLSVIV